MLWKKTLRHLSITAIALIALSGAAHLLLRQVSTGPLHRLVEENLTQALGLEVELDRLVVAVLPTPHFQAEGIRVANLPDRTGPDLLRVERLDLGVALWPLVERKLVIDALELEGADLHLETDEDGRLAGGFPFSGLANDDDSDALELRLRRLDVEDVHVFYRDRRSGAAHSLRLHAAFADSSRLDSEISVGVEGELDGARFALNGQIGSLSELLTPTRPFPVHLEGQLFEAQVEAKGTVREPWKVKGIDLVVTAKIAELVVRARPLPEFGTIRFRGHLSDLDGSLGFEELSVETTKAGTVRIDAHGVVDDLLAVDEVEVEASIETASLVFLVPLLEPMIDFPIPAISALSVRAKLSSQEERLILDGTVHAETADEDLVLHAEGGIQDLVQLRGLDVAFDLRANDLASVTALVPEFPSHGSFGPVAASGRLESHDGSLGASGIEIRVGDREQAFVEVEGHVGDVVTLQDVAFEVSFGATSLHHLKELLDREISGTSPFEGSASIRDEDGSLGLEHLRLHGGEEGPIEIHLEARFDDLPARDQIDIELGLRSEDAQMLAALLGIDHPVQGPVSFEGKIHGSQHELEAQDVTLRIGRSTVAGALSGSFAKHSRPRLHASLRSDHLLLQDLGLVPAKRATTSPVPDAREKGMSDVVLPFEELRHIDLDLGLRLDRVTGYQGLDVRDVDLLARLEDGQLVVTDASARYQGGQLVAGLRADARTPRPRLAVELHATEVDVARFVSQFQETTDFSGLADLDVDLHARGETLDALLRSLDGRTALAIRDGNAASRIARQFVVDLVQVAFSRLPVEDTPRIGCGLVDLEIQSGIATVRTLSLSEKDVSATATGRIDLVKSLYDLRVVPKTNNPGVLSLSPEVLVKGPLGSPTFHPLKRTLVTSFARGLFHNARKAGGAVLLPFGASHEAKTADSGECRIGRSGSALRAPQGVSGRPQ